MLVRVAPQLSPCSERSSAFHPSWSSDPPGLDIGLDFVVDVGDEDVGSGASFFHGGHLVSFGADL